MSKLLQLASSLISASALLLRQDFTPPTIESCVSSLSQTLDDAACSGYNDECMQGVVHNLKACAGEWGMEEPEYLQLMTYVRDHAPQRLLIWGLGYDSVIYNRLNQGGTTMFLEPDANWIQALAQTSEGKKLNVVPFDASRLNSTAATFPSFLQEPHRAELAELKDQCWETTLVDSPLGWSNELPGRAVPIFTAVTDAQKCQQSGAYHNKKEVSVWVHDCLRSLEDTVSKKFTEGAFQLVSETGPKKLRQYRLCKSESECSPR